MPDKDELIRRGILRKLHSQPPPLEMQLCIQFYEDFKYFPKIKKLILRVNPNSPLEICAKILARMNGHKDEWEKYEFQIVYQYRKADH